MVWHVVVCVTLFVDYSVMLYGMCFACFFVIVDSCVCLRNVYLRVVFVVYCVMLYDVWLCCLF